MKYNAYGMERLIPKPLAEILGHLGNYVLHLTAPPEKPEVTPASIQHYYTGPEDIVA